MVKSHPPNFAELMDQQQRQVFFDRFINAPLDSAFFTLAEELESHPRPRWKRILVDPLVDPLHRVQWAVTQQIHDWACRHGAGCDMD